MTARRPALRQRELTRALKATTAAGIAVLRIEIDREGNIIILTEAPGKRTVATDEADLDKEMGLS